MDFIERYVFAVTERLPEDTREDVARELRANIEDMLPEDATENDVRTVLEKLGNPAALSNEYRQVKRYLIGPALYDTYISVLKLVIGIAIVVFVSLALIGDILMPLNNAEVFKISADFFGDMLSSAIEGAAQAFIWVTFVFVILERTGVIDGNLTFGKQKWSVEDLKSIAVNGKGKISRSETIVSFVFTIIFTTLFVFQPQLIGWYKNGENGLTLVSSVFNVVHLQVYIPAIILLAIFQFGITIYKIISMRWTFPLAVVNTLNNLAISVLLYIMLREKSLLNPDIVTQFAEAIKTTPPQIVMWMGKSITVFIAVFIIGCGLDSIMGFVKCNKLNSISIKVK